MPQDTEAARAASVREWHRFLNTYGVENVSMFADDFGSMFLRDQHGVVAPALEHMT